MFVMMDAINILFPSLYERVVTIKACVCITMVKLILVFHQV
jgi:hypothetical protein